MEAQLTQGPIGKTLVRLTIPMTFGIMGVLLFNIADTFFVAQLGTTELAALSFCFPVIFVITSIALGLGASVSAVVSQAIGQADEKQAKRLTTDSLLLATFISLVVLLLGLLFLEPTFSLLGAHDNILPFIKHYMNIWFFGTLFVVVPMVGNSAIRATGDMRTPSVIMILAAGINVILDPLLIFGIGPFPQLGIEGAAIATVISRFTTLLMAFYVLFIREKMIIFRCPTIIEIAHSWKKILHIAIPSSGARIILPVGIGIITRILATHGSAAVAAYGASSRIETIAIGIYMALGSTLAPFVGQNFGARQLNRVKRALKLSFNFSLVWGLFMALILFLSRNVVAHMFSHNPDVQSIIALYFTIVPISFGLRGVSSISHATLNATSHPFSSAFLSALFMFGIAIPFAYLGSSLFSIPGVFGAVALASLLGGSISFFWVYKILQRYHHVPIHLSAQNLQDYPPDSI